MMRPSARSRGGPEAGCSPCAPTMASPLLAGLSEAGLLEPALADWLAAEEVQTATDLIHCFRTEVEVFRSAPVAHAAWPPADLIFSHKAWSSGSRRATRPTAMPRIAISSASAEPMPEEAPVMRMCWAMLSKGYRSCPWGANVKIRRAIVDFVRRLYTGVGIHSRP